MLKETEEVSRGVDAWKMVWILQDFVQKNSAAPHSSDDHPTLAYLTKILINFMASSRNRRLSTFKVD